MYSRKKLQYKKKLILVGSCVLDRLGQKYAKTDQNNYLLQPCTQGQLLLLCRYKKEDSCYLTIELYSVCGALSLWNGNLQNSAVLLQHGNRSNLTFLLQSGPWRKDIEGRNASTIFYSMTISITSITRSDRSAQIWLQKDV